MIGSHRTVASALTSPFVPGPGALDTKTGGFFDHRDPEIVKALGEAIRPTQEQDDPKGKPLPGPEGARRIWQARRRPPVTRRSW